MRARASRYEEGVEAPTPFGAESSEERDDDSDEELAGSATRSALIRWPEARGEVGYSSVEEEEDARDPVEDCVTARTRRGDAGEESAEDDAFRNAPGTYLSKSWRSLFRIRLLEDIEDPEGGENEEGLEVAGETPGDLGEPGTPSFTVGVMRDLPKA